MKKTSLSGGVVHNLPQLMSKALTSKSSLSNIWEDLTPLARNEWICWVTSAKKQETVDKRTQRMLEDLNKGKRRPCCWPGCPHRKK